MKKFKLIFDKNAEIPWLNRMAEEGWNLKKFGYGLYEFEPCAPGEFVYETDLKDRLTHVSSEYRNILESQGIELIPSGGFWFMVRRRKADGPLELYTDYESRLAQYKRIRRMFKGGTLIELIVALAEAWGFAETGSWFLLAVAGLLSILGLVLMNEVRRLNTEIAAMENRPDEQTSRMTVGFGMFVMACGFLIRESIPHPAYIVLMLVGIAIALYGVYKIQSKKRENS